MAEVERVTVRVAVPIALERIEWQHMETEDYYVELDGTCIGTVGQYDDGWSVSSSTYATDPHMIRIEKRRYQTRETAAGVLVQFWLDRRATVRVTVTDESALMGASNG